MGATLGSGLSSSQVLERIERAKGAQQKAAAELAVLVDQAVGLGISWPAIATRLGVTRQAAASTTSVATARFGKGRHP